MGILYNGYGMSDPFSLYIIVCMNIICGSVGYILGMMSNKEEIPKVKSFFTKRDDKIEQSKVSIDINDSTYVSEINTKGLEKKYTTLGETQQSTEDISSAVNKLKNMKR